MVYEVDLLKNANNFEIIVNYIPLEETLYLNTLARIFFTQGWFVSIIFKTDSMIFEKKFKMLNLYRHTDGQTNGRHAKMNKKFF